MNFYVYSILDPRKPGSYKYDTLEFSYEPIYIGKGKGNRVNEHLHSNRLKKNDFKNNKIKKILNMNLKPLIIKLQDNLTEKEAFNLEKNYISTIGRYPNGPLTNLTDGGEGVSGLKHSQESLDKMSKTWFNKDTAGWNKGMTMSKDHCKKLSQAHNGHTLSEETKNKLSKQRKGLLKSKEHKNRISKSLCKNRYLVSYPDGSTKTISNYNKFSKENGLSAGQMCQVLKGNQESHKGFKITRCS